ncbi:hypothetical protein DV707_17450 (plasmid) [Halobellus limi]|uniref:Universal stress protein n=1 Tax=Halobellus limi TaxID=699433 RepID=A0A4D6H8E6_9EURY|nr:hypothetical protein DV707_17450 [Halobellus limi]
MPDNVLVAFDGSSASERGLTYAIKNVSNTSITAIYLINPISSVIGVEAGGSPVAEDTNHERAQSKRGLFPSAPQPSVPASGGLPRCRYWVPR